MKTRFKALIFTVLFIGFIYYMESHRDDAVCDAYAGYVARSFSGVVVKKFIDPHNHSFPFLYIMSSDGIEKLNLVSDKNHTYNVIGVNDAIRKVKNDPWIYKIKDNQLSKFKLIDFGCKEAITN